MGARRWNAMTSIEFSALAVSNTKHAYNVIQLCSSSFTFPPPPCQLGVEQRAKDCTSSLDFFLQLPRPCLTSGWTLPM